MTLSGLSYLASAFLFWWLASLVVGLCVGWFTAARTMASGWALWIIVLAVVLLAAVYRLLPDRYGLWLDTAALFLFAYFVGCLIGSMLHTLFGAAEQPEELPIMPSLPLAAAIETASAPAAAVPPKPVAPAPVSLSDPPPPTEADKPAGLAAPHTGKADDLQLISGIGPQNESRLHGLGIYYFYQIAGWSAAEVNWVGHFLAFPGRIEREHWVAQAKALLDAGKGSPAALPPEAEEVGAVAEAPAQPAPSPGSSPSAEDKPAGLSAPRASGPDNLQEIRGIGPQNEGRLHGLGIYHFDQIAGWSAKEINWVGHFLAFPGRIEREEWVAQAKILAAGGKL